MKKPSDFLAAFDELVSMKFQLYNGLFLTLPFANLADLGIKLPVFSEMCHTGLSQGYNPKEIVEAFFRELTHADDTPKRISVLFLLLQLIERQIVLFDALEDAAFSETHDLSGPGTIAHFTNLIADSELMPQAIKIMQNYHTRIVLTAHPTQFYTSQVLGIIQDMGKAIQSGNLHNIRDLLLQLGKTPFQNNQKPSPLSEAESIIHHLEEVFYAAVKSIQVNLSSTFPCHTLHSSQFSIQIEMGFWPGGDRDGNPFVTTPVTLSVASKLKSKILQIYLKELLLLKKRLTFKGITERLHSIEMRLYSTWNKSLQKSDAVQPENVAAATYYLSAAQLIKDLEGLHAILKNEHQSLFIDQLEAFMVAVRTFGFHFSSLDLRQDSQILTSAVEQILKRLSSTDALPILIDEESLWYSELETEAKIQILDRLLQSPLPPLTDFGRAGDPFPLDALAKDTLQSLIAIPHIQSQNGEKGLHRYIISNTHGLHNVLELILLVRWSGWKQREIPLDIVPLFESIQDLEDAHNNMQRLYEHPLYRRHLASRHEQQTVMLGFSDSTKDGGYMMANWMIFKAKQKISAISEKSGIRVVFFDGRGGPPARGGGSTHKFYRAIGGSFAQHEIHLTIQGQTISSQFGTLDSAKYNIEQLFTGGLEHHLFPNAFNRIAEEDEHLFEELAMHSHTAYLELKEDQLFIPYLETFTPLNFYGQLNISSRPTSRRSAGGLNLKDLLLRIGQRAASPN